MIVRKWGIELDDDFNMKDKQDDDNEKKGRVKCVAKKHKQTSKKLLKDVDNIGSSN